MRLSSSAFSEGSEIPRRYTCDGEDLSPPLDWSDSPAGKVARSYARAAFLFPVRIRPHCIADAKKTN